jgi:Flp pilus assembly protein TadG
MAAVRNKRANSGVTVLETALVLPILLTVLLGVFEYGWYFIAATDVTAASRAGARQAILPDATSDQVRATVRQVLANYHLEATSYTVTLTPSDVSTAASGSTVAVQVVVPYKDSVSLTNSSLIPVPVNITSITSMAKEGP